MKKHRTLPLLLLLCTATASCGDGKRHSFQPRSWHSQRLPSGTVRWKGKAYPYRNGEQILFYIPKKDTGRSLILLHGWNQKAEMWRTKTKAVKLAEKYGITLILPSMRTSNYLIEYYPETRRIMRWSPVPGVLWIGRVILPWIRNTLNPKFLYIAGVSTGARGAIMIGELFPEFKGVGYISGDWDVIKDKGNLYKMSFGSLKKFRSRWADHNTAYMAAKLKGTKVFIAHSTNDKVTPAWQTALMQTDLKKLGITTRYCMDSSGGHTWQYWNSRLPVMFQFWFAKP